MLFGFAGIGNFSHTFGWDSGMSVVNVPVEIIYTDGSRWENNGFDGVVEYNYNCHGGSRSAEYIVEAEDFISAYNKVRQFIDCHYPEYQD